MIQTIIKPIITEKSSIMQGKGQYAFLVARTSNKTSIKQAIKEMYGAEVKDIRVMIMPKKERAVGKGHIWAKRSVMKKAIVTLKDGKTIDPNKLGDSKKPSKTEKATKTPKKK